MHVDDYLGWVFWALLPFSVTPSSVGIPPEGRFWYWFCQKMVPIFRFAKHTKTNPVPVEGQDSVPFRLLPTVRCPTGKSVSAGTQPLLRVQCKI